MLTFRPLRAKPEPWMLDGQLAAYQTLGAQVRALVNDDDIVVGAFPILGRDEIGSLLAVLEQWRPRGVRTSTCLVVGIYGEAAAVWGPSFASHPERRGVPEIELVDAAVRYLNEV